MRLFAFVVGLLLVLVALLLTDYRLALGFLGVGMSAFGLFVDGDA